MIDPAHALFLRKMAVFYPYMFKRVEAATKAAQRFVYYTSAATALSVIRNKQAWMRNASVMNDYMEVEHGLELLASSYKTRRDAFRKYINSFEDNLCGKLEAYFDGWQPKFKYGTYLTCLSEHDQTEDHLGRLSMWRAYGGSSGVALVLNGTPFLTPADALHAQTSPVAYLDQIGFHSEFEVLYQNLIQEEEFLKEMGSDEVFGYLVGAFMHSALCTKHPGFREEREWRILYNPSYQRSVEILEEIEVINSIPQIVCKIPLKNIPEKGLIGVELAEIIDRIIVGPSEFPFRIAEALTKALDDEGVVGANEKVFVSRIPLRS